jgi:hypothetical protein
MKVQKTLAQVVGVVLTLVGVAGFFSGGSLFGFAVNTLHNVVHLVTGLAGVYAGFAAGGMHSRLYNKSLGVVYIVVALLGFLAPGLMLSILAINTADNFLHLVIGVALAGVGFGVKENTTLASV